MKFTDPRLPLDMKLLGLKSLANQMLELIECIEKELN